MMMRRRKLYSMMILCLKDTPFCTDKYNKFDICVVDTMSVSCHGYSMSVMCYYSNIKGQIMNY